MKKNIKVIAILVLIFAFIIMGFHESNLDGIRTALVEYLNNRDFGSFKNSIDINLSNELKYHDLLMDVNSVKDNLLNKKIIEKSDVTAVKASSEKLVTLYGEEISEEETKKVVDRINEFKKISEENGARFIYAMAPNKTYYEEIPSNVKDFSKENINLFDKEMRVSQIPYLEYIDEFSKNGVNSRDIFFYTDHHWKPEYGFLATKILCERLNELYGFKYDKGVFDINNYEVKNYDNYFLGSYGKKTGRFFSWYGADDIKLIVPKFETNLTEKRPVVGEERTGKFEDTALFMENINTKGYYKYNSYATYSGGDFRIQILKNNLNPNGKKIVLIRDSFSCVIAPFLSLVASELDILDVRNDSSYKGEKINAYDYIRDNKPDYVVVLYCGVGDIDDYKERYNFGN